MHLGFRRARTRRKDVQNQFGAIHHALPDRVLNVLALRGGELVVEYDDRRARRAHFLAQLLHLSGAEVRRCIGPIELLRYLTDDHGAGGVGEAFQLIQVFAKTRASAAAFERRPDEERPLFRLPDLNRALGDLSLR